MTVYISGHCLTSVHTLEQVFPGQEVRERERDKCVSIYLLLFYLKKFSFLLNI